MIWSRYVVNYDGYSRTTGDMDIWISRVPPLRLELLTLISGVEFRGALRCTGRRRYGWRSVSLIRLEDLITDKRASGRLKDLADVQELE
jgi:hypothetical protein